jgi:hypothetical protein
MGGHNEAERKGDTLLLVLSAFIYGSSGRATIYQ